MRIALFPGSFDPFTIGHKDVVRQAIPLFDKLIIAVGYNHTKKGFLSLEERVSIIEESVADLKGDGADIAVISYSGLTIDACHKHHAQFIVRGVRSTADFEMESVIAHANKKMAPGITTVFINASPEYSFISSTVVKDVVINGGDPKDFMSGNIDLNKYLKK